jgi:hypothetical protein
MNTPIVPNGSAIMRQGFGENSIETRRETAQTAAAAQAQALIQARFIVALQRPRDWDNVRIKLLNECSRPTFARNAFFSVPRGDKPGKITRIQGRIEGLSVRYVEAAIRIMGNIWQSTETIFDDQESRIIRISLTDLEVNSGFSRDVSIGKTQERKQLRNNQIALGTRTNSAGSTIYIVAATEDELLQREGAIISKTFRTEGIRLVPADYIEECEQRIIETISSEDAKDPSAARKQLADAFASMQVMPSDLKSYLGHDLAQCSPVELQDLRGLYTAIKSGETSWQDVVADRSVAGAAEGATGASGQTAAASSDEPKQSRGSRVAARVRGQRQDKPSEPEPPFGTEQQKTQSQGQQRPAVPEQTTIPGSGSAPANTAAAQTAVAAPSIADERAAKLVEQKKLVDAFPKDVGVPVTFNMAGGQKYKTRTAGMAGIHGDLACVQVEGIDGPVPLSKIELRDFEPGTDDGP